jgi:heme-degrading monooxygenase HmoA
MIARAWCGLRRLAAQGIATMIVAVFRNRLVPAAQDEYGTMARQMSELVRGIPGYISHKLFVAEDGERATIVEFESEAALQEWKLHPRHLEAKRLGFTKFFSAFKYQICDVTHARTWEGRTTAK